MIKLAKKLKSLPQKPGVYLFKDTNGEIIYIGKAKVLKNRVKSYFMQSGGRLPRTEMMIGLISDLDYMVVSSELESLILENILIKKHKPRFNISLRDDKNYQFIKIDYDTPIPQIYTVRSIPDRGRGKAKYFGPYTSGLSVRNTLNLLQRIFHLCRSKKVGAKPCFAYHLGRCPGVCIGKVSLFSYRQSFRLIENFLKHRQTEVLKNLRKEMQKAAATHKFEKAATARDKIHTLEHLWERQKIVSPKNENHDYLGSFVSPHDAVMNVFLVRGGKLIGQENFTIKHHREAPLKILEQFLIQYYSEVSEIPGEIFVPEKLKSQAIIEKALTKLRGRKVIIRTPQRGNKRRLLLLSSENAKIYFERELSSLERRIVDALPQLQSLLALPSRPRRIEGYDISNIQGTNPVGSMVVFKDARPAKSEYRKFKINRTVSAEGLPKADDFAMMREMLERRFKRLGETDWPKPDLIIIDGGKGQLNVAISVLKAMSHRLIPVIGLAKRLEEIFVPASPARLRNGQAGRPGQKNSLILPPDSPALFLLQQIRDEAHRFAVTFHAQRRLGAQTHSRLDDIPGIGPATRKKLISRFGNLRMIKAAKLETLAPVVGKALAKTIKEYL